MHDIPLNDTQRIFAEKNHNLAVWMEGTTNEFLLAGRVLSAHGSRGTLLTFKILRFIQSIFLRVKSFKHYFYLYNL